MKRTQEYVYTNSVPKVLKIMCWCPHISQVIRVTWYSNVGTAERMEYKVYMWLTFDQCRQLGALTLDQYQKFPCGLQSALPIHSSSISEVLHHYSLCCKVVFTVEKHLHMSGPTPLKSALYKGQWQCILLQNMNYIQQYNNIYFKVSF